MKTNIHFRTSSKNKNHLFLDLDQTLVSSTETHRFFKRPDYVELLQFFDHDIDQHYVTIARPFLQPFLDWAFRNFNVHVWTAASEMYGRHVIERFILNNNNKKRKLGLFLFNKHTDVSRAVKPQTTKALDMLWDFWKLGDEFNQWNTFILDDLETVKQYQPENAIHIFPFFIENENSENDNHLWIIQSEIDSLVKRRNMARRAKIQTTEDFRHDHHRLSSGKPSIRNVQMIHRTMCSCGRPLFDHLNRSDRFPASIQNHDTTKASSASSSEFRSHDKNKRGFFQPKDVSSIASKSNATKFRPSSSHHCHHHVHCRQLKSPDLPSLNSTSFNSPQSRQLFFMNQNPVDKSQTRIQVYRPFH